MNFNDAIPLKSRAKFSEGSRLSSSRDSRNNSQLWKKGRDTESQQYGFGQSIQKISREVSKLKRRIVGGFVPIPLSESFHPFKIYPAKTYGSIGITFLGSDGTPTQCNIDSTKPTDFTATPPTVNPSTDAWRLWYVKTGFVQVRPLYFIFGTSENFSPWIDPFGRVRYGIAYAAENYSYLMNVTFGTDSFNGFTDSQTPIIISGNNAPYSNGQTIFSIWVKITEDDGSGHNNLHAQICAQTIDQTNSGVSLFPENVAGIIPIGLVQYFFNKSDVSVSQFVYDNISNRFPIGQGNYVNFLNQQNSLIWNTRGFWYPDEGLYFPDDLNQQVIYPGDILINGDDSSIYQWFNKPGFYSDPNGSFNPWFPM